MARSAAADTRFLETHAGKWRVTLAVPRKLHKRMGTRLKRPLNTDSLAEANRLKWPVVAEFRAMIEAAQLPVEGEAAVIRRALTLAENRKEIECSAELGAFDDSLHEEAEGIRGPTLNDGAEDDTTAFEEYDPAREALAARFLSIAAGRATPIGLHHAAFVEGSQNKPRTKADDYRAVRFLGTWCEQNGVPPTVQAITRKVAARFMDGLAGVAGGQGAVTLNKYLLRLSRYWQWLVMREHAEADVFAGLKLTPPKVAHDEQERAFTDEEVAVLLSGPATPHMHDLMRIAALTGARLDAIVDLRVADCEAGLFTFKPQKKEKKPRAVPIHPALADIVKRRSEGRSGDDEFFPEWPGPQKEGSLRERSFKASNQFTQYRRKAGVDEVVEGKRRALVNFHSFRRWFITKAERADQPEHIIAVVVGHKRQGMTLGRYSAGPLMEQARRCVEAVSLPT